MEVRNRAATAQGASSAQMLVVNPGADSFEVYDPRDPSRVYQVTGDADSPACTCSQFTWNQNQTEGWCRHVEAVFGHLKRDAQLDGQPTPQPMRQAPSLNSRRRPRQPDGPAPSGAGHAEPGQPGLMTLKRSVSPDGRIDSLSLEFTLPVDPDAAADLEGYVLDVIERQDLIVEEYLDRRRNGLDRQDDGAPATDGAVAAVLKDVGGMQTRYGFRYFINVEAGRQTYKLFGTRQQLMEQLANLGRGDIRLSKGLRLDLPCLAVLEQSEDGRYTNVTEVQPRQDGQRARR